MSGLDLDIQIKKILDEWADEQEDNLEVIAEDLANKGAEILKQTSPRKRPQYYKYWKVRTENGLRGKEFIIHNSKYYNLTHLLEFGHPIARGGKVIGHSGAIPHIAPVEKALIEEFKKRSKPE